MIYLRRYALWIMVVTAACTVGAWQIAAHQRSVSYQTAATVNVQSALVAGQAPLPPDLATEAAIVTSEVVLAAPARTFGMSPSDLARNLSVTNPANTDILQIACSMPAARPTTRCANEVAVAYANYRNDVGLPRKTQQRDPVQVQIVARAPMPIARPGIRYGLLALGVVVGLALGLGTAFLDDRLSNVRT
jgi:capsular polysaccharide biosynthesis protein